MNNKIFMLIYISYGVILGGDYVKKRLQRCNYWAVNRPKTGACFGLNW